MPVHVAMIVRNESDRHLDRALECASAVTQEMDGLLLVTDDCSDDGTYEQLLDHARDVRQMYVRRNPEPQFMLHEGRARQAHLDWVGQYAEEGDWVLSLDADETINSIKHLKGAVADAWESDEAILMPLYEFWSMDPLQYRVDGYWFGTQAYRLFRWHEGGRVKDKEFGCGSEPTYVLEALRSGRVHRQSELHLLHWGYVNAKDRVIKHDRYSKRVGGHGHNNAHVRSIVQANPTLRSYTGEIHE